MFSKKKHLKGKSISITESLTSFRMKKLKEAREKYGFKHVWTIDFERICSFVCVIRTVICSVIRTVIFFWGNFAACFFETNDKWDTPLIQVLLFQILHIIIFLHKAIIFSYNNI